MQKQPTPQVAGHATDEIADLERRLRAADPTWSRTTLAADHGWYRVREGLAFVLVAGARQALCHYFSPDGGASICVVRSDLLGEMLTHAEAHEALGMNPHRGASVKIGILAIEMLATEPGLAEAFSKLGPARQTHIAANLEDICKAVLGGDAGAW